MSTANIVTLRKLAKENNLLGSNYEPKNFQPSSYDLRIGTIYKEGVVISKSKPRSDGYFTKVKPSEIISFSTLEEVNIPQDYCGTVFAINKLSSKGFLILNPGHVDPGFNGPISICAINLSNKNVDLNLEDKIFTLVLTKLDEKITDEKDKYVNVEFDSRESYETFQFKNKFQNLSNSFFDLVLQYDKANKALWYIKIFVSLKKVLSISFTSILAVLGIFAGFNLFYPNSVVFNLDKKINIEELKISKDLMEDSLKTFHTNSVKTDSLKIDSIVTLNEILIEELNK